MTKKSMTSIDTGTEMSSVEDVRLRVNLLLKDIFTARKLAAENLSPRYAALWKATESYVLAGGKRVRPYITVMGYQLLGGSEYEKIIHVATAQELLNQALLMHDDIIDRDYIRYGTPNVAGQFEAYYRETRNYSTLQSKHYANSAAMLAGDLCISEAFLVLRQAGFSSSQTAKLQDFLHEAMFTVAGGELLDSETYNASITETDPLVIAHHKTAVYSVVVPLLSGAYVAGASDEDMYKLRLFGENLGVAYQLADDLLGVFGDSGITGKSSIGDLREGKHTYMMQYAWQHSTDQQLAVLRGLFGKADLTEAQADEIRAIIVDSGSRSRAEDMIDSLVTEAITYLDDVSANEAHKQIVKEFCLAATRRDK